MDQQTLKQNIRNTVLEMIKDGGLQVETYIDVGNYRTELVTRIATNEDEHGYGELVENREEIDMNKLIERIGELK